MAPIPTPPRLSDVRGAAQLAFDAARGLVDVVERMHHTIQQRPAPIGPATVGHTRGITGLVYRSVRGGVDLVGRSIEATLATLAPLVPDESTRGSGPRRDTLLAVINGLHGDHLHRTGNPLATAMSLRLHGQGIDAADPAVGLARAGSGPASGKLVILVHGLCMNDRGWLREGHDHGAALAAEQGWTPLYLRYSTGRSIAENGRDFAALLDTLVAHWPCALQSLVIIGHSMGGLVARSACQQAAEHGQAWLPALRRLVFLGTPHHGSPLERGGRKLFDTLGLSPYAAPIAGMSRHVSAGIRDLHHGSLTEGEHRHVDLPVGVHCQTIAATLGARRDLLAERLVGDGLVPLNSALGRHRDPARRLHFAAGDQWVAHQTGHLELLSSPAVFERMRSWLADEPAAPAHGLTPPDGDPGNVVPG